MYINKQILDTQTKTKTKTKAKTARTMELASFPPKIKRHHTVTQ